MILTSVSTTLAATAALRLQEIDNDPEQLHFGLVCPACKDSIHDAGGRALKHQHGRRSIKEA